MIVRLKKRSSPFVTLDKTIFGDPRISAAAKGVWAYLMGKPDDWQVKVKDICAHMLDGRDAVIARLNELVRFGYARHVQGRNHGGIFLPSEWTIFETPDLETSRTGSEKGRVSVNLAGQADRGQLNLFRRANRVFDANKPQPGLPVTVKPDTVEPFTANPTVPSIESTKEGITNDPPNQKAAAHARDPCPPCPPASKPEPAAAVAAPEAETGKPARLQSGAAFPRELMPARELLLRHGFDRLDAQEQVLKFGEQQVRIQVGNLEHRQERTGSKIDRPRGWLITAMHEQRPLDKRASPAMTGEELGRREKERIAALQSKAASIDTTAARDRQAQRDRMETSLGALSETDWIEHLAAVAEDVASGPESTRKWLEPVERANPITREMVFRRLTMERTGSK